jgi:hypothetical protein
MTACCDNILVTLEQLRERERRRFEREIQEALERVMAGDVGEGPAQDPEVDHHMAEWLRAECAGDEGRKRRATAAIDRILRAGPA